MTKKAVKLAPAKSEPKPASPSIAKQPAAAKQQMPKETAAPKAKAATQRNAKPHQSKKAGESKQDRVVGMLRRSEGTTVATIMKATGWQKHSVHGFFAGVVRKKLGLNLVSEMKGDTRVYRVVEGKSGKAASSVRKRAA